MMWEREYLHGFIPNLINITGGWAFPMDTVFAY
jgi:hypothetical protein